MSDIDRQVSSSINRLNIVLETIDDPKAARQIEQVKRNLDVIGEMADACRGDGPRTDGGTLVAHEQDPDDNEYATPPKVWRPLSRAVDGFDVDPASGAESTPIAPTRYTKEDDGLRQSWHGWVFLNPPWSSNGDGSAKEQWLSKARSEAARDAVDGVVVLLPVDTSAHWFHDHVLDAPVVCLVGPGRIPFQGEDRNPSFELLIAVYGDAPGVPVDALDSLGAVIQGREVYEPTQQATINTVTDGGETPERWDTDSDRSERRP